MNSLQKVAAASLLAVTAFASAAEQNTFDLLNKGKKTATTSFTLQKGKDGLKAHSAIDYVADGSGNTTKVDYRIGNDGLFQTGNIARPSAQTLTYYKPNSARTAFDVSLVEKNASKGTTQISIAKSDVLVAFPDDPSAWQMMLEVTAAHPHADHIYYLLVLSPNSWTPNRVEPFRMNSSTESAGVLDGKPVTLQHFKVDFNGGPAHLYADADGRLMQAVTPFGISHVRSNFALEKK